VQVKCVSLLSNCSIRICAVFLPVLQFAILIRCYYSEVAYCLISQVVPPVMFSELSFRLVLRDKKGPIGGEAGQVKSVFVKCCIICVKKDCTTFNFVSLCVDI
jgi:hypothetical protein